MTAGWSGYFSPRWSFSINVPQPPAAPTPSSPANNSVVTKLKPDIKVAKVNGASQYHFRLFQNGTLIREKTQTSNTWKQTSNLTKSTTYTWDCQVMKSNVWSAYFSPAWTFTTSANARTEMNNPRTLMQEIDQ
jgi:hypothetical protein